MARQSDWDRHVSGLTHAMQKRREKVMGNTYDFLSKRPEEEMTWTNLKRLFDACCANLYYCDGLYNQRKASVAMVKMMRLRRHDGPRFMALMLTAIRDFWPTVDVHRTHKYLLLIRILVCEMWYELDQINSSDVGEWIAEAREFFAAFHLVYPISHLPQVEDVETRDMKSRKRLMREKKRLLKRLHCEIDSEDDQGDHQLDLSKIDLEDLIALQPPMEETTKGRTPTENEAADKQHKRNRSSGQAPTLINEDDPHLNTTGDHSDSGDDEESDDEGSEAESGDESHKGEAGGDINGKLTGVEQINNERQGGESAGDNVEVCLGESVEDDDGTEPVEVEDAKPEWRPEWLTASARGGCVQQPAMWLQCMAVWFEEFLKFQGGAFKITDAVEILGEVDFHEPEKTPRPESEECGAAAPECETDVDSEAAINPTFEVSDQGGADDESDDEQSSIGESPPPGWPTLPQHRFPLVPREEIWALRRVAAASDDEDAPDPEVVKGIDFAKFVRVLAPLVKSLAAPAAPSCLWRRLEDLMKSVFLRRSKFVDLPSFVCALRVLHHIVEAIVVSGAVQACNQELVDKIRVRIAEPLVAVGVDLLDEPGSRALANHLATSISSHNFLEPAWFV